MALLVEAPRYKSEGCGFDFAIRLAGSPLCSNYGEHDTLMHRIIECGEGRKIWEWTRNRIAWILQMDSVWIPNEWTIRT